VKSQLLYISIHLNFYWNQSRYKHHIAVSV